MKQTLFFSEYIKEDGNNKLVGGINFPDGEAPHEYYFRKGERLVSRTVMVAKQCVENHNFDESLKAREDPNLWVKILRDHDPIKVHEPLAIKHMRPDSLTSDSELVWRNEKKSINMLADLYSELNKYREKRLKMADYRFAKNLLDEGSVKRARKVLKRLYHNQDGKDIRVIALILVSLLPFGHNATIDSLERVYDIVNNISF